MPIYTVAKDTKNRTLVSLAEPCKSKIEEDPSAAKKNPDADPPPARLLVYENVQMHQQAYRLATREWLLVIYYLSLHVKTHFICETHWNRNFDNK